MKIHLATTKGRYRRTLCLDVREMKHTTLDPEKVTCLKYQDKITKPKVPKNN